MRRVNEPDAPAAKIPKAEASARRRMLQRHFTVVEFDGPLGVSNGTLETSAAVDADNELMYIKIDNATTRGQKLEDLQR